MADDRVVTMSAQGYKALINSTNGKGLHWVTDVNAELPVKVRSNGYGSERPQTLTQAFYNTCKSGGERNALFVQREGKVVTWSWDQYLRETLKFAKGLHKLNITERSAVAIMGFNSPEWVIAFVGGIMYNCVGTGIYSTNTAEACLYQAEHSDAEIVVVETNEMLKRFTKNLNKLPKVKAIVVWGEKSLPADEKDSRFYLWKDFLKIGSDIPDKVILEKAQK